jgi:subtilisin-like proprotein convertase family protein
VTVNPVVNASGAANITVTMVNGDGQTVTSKFKATFTPVAYPPDLFPIADHSTAAGTLATIPLIFGNIGYSQDQLTVSFGSSNTNLVPVGNMKLSGTNLLISPLGVQQGTATITVTVANTNTPPQSTNQSFKLNVLPNPVPVFAASGAIVINDNAAATPYPSTITVAGLTGRTVASVTASLVGFGHQFPSDVSVLLVGPQGQKVVLMSRAGGSSAVTNTRLTFDDSAPAALPQFALITDGTFKPTDYKVSDTFFSPAPLAPYSHALNVFNGTDPNGDWKLYVQDDQQQETGVITSGWVLAITTSGPSISNPGPTTIVENSVSNIINFSVSSPTVNASNLIVTATNTADSPKGLISSLTVGGSGSSRFLVVTPGLNLPSLVQTNDGTNIITMTVSDGSATNSTSFPLTVSYVNQLPTMNPPVLQDLTTPANVPISTSFSLADVDTPASNLVVSATTTIPGLGTATVSTVGSNSTVAYAPKGFVGTNIVRITVKDGGNTISNGFVVVTTASLPPTLAAIAPQSTPGAPTNSTKTVTLNVSPATGIPGFTFTGTTTNHALVSSVTFTTNANSVVANLNVVGAMVGFDFVTITVSDKNTNSTRSFPLTVTPTGVVTLSPIAPVTTSINASPKVSLTASSPDTAVNNLHFTGSSTNSFLVSGFSFAFNGRNMIATINLINNRIGKDFVTISTTDGFSTASQSFVLTVTGTPTNSAPQLTLSASGGKLTLNLQGSPNTGYTIQGSASLAQPITWGTITNLTADATGRASFTATPAAGVPVQFIRAKSP